VRIRALPEDASLVVDGNPIANGAAVELTGRPRRVTVTAPGHEPRSEVIAPDEGRTEILLLLRRLR
jgi:hypothetical protein